jgi:Tfp pilus assembly protein PilF
MTDVARLGAALEHVRAGRFADAERELHAMLDDAPGDADVMQLLGVAASSQGRLDEGLEWFDRAMASRPGSFALMQNRAYTLFHLGRLEEARAQAQAMATLDATHPALRDLTARLVHEEGVVHHNAGRFADAVDAYRRAVAGGLDLPPVRGNLARALADLAAVQANAGDVANARANVDAALALQPGFALALNTLGVVLREEGRLDEAAKAFERALAADPAYARPAYNLSLARLTAGRFEEGWRLYDARFRGTPPQCAWRELPMPRWSAADLGRGHRVAIWREQGIGDQVLFATTLTDLAARGEAFTLEFDARLVPALRRSHPDWTVVTPEESARAFTACDRHAPLADIPALLRPSRESFRAQPRALLAADAARVAQYRSRLGSGGRRSIGISWRSFQGRDRAHLESVKSAPLEAFAPLAARGDLRLVDLQYGDTADERSRFARELARLEELDLFTDLDGVLAAIEACDAVVTTSSATAHLAGAVGKPTYLIYLRGMPPFHYWAPDESGRCRWYPSVRIVTGAQVDTWPRAIERVDELLGR